MTSSDSSAGEDGEPLEGEDGEPLEGEDGEPLEEDSRTADEHVDRDDNRDEHVDRPVDRGRTLLERVRTEPGPHAVAMVVMVTLGLALSWLHWLGLVLGGALVALTAPSLRRGVVGALGFGAVVLVAFALTLGGSAWTVLEMTPVVYLVVASAFGLPVLGSLVRGLE